MKEEKSVLPVAHVPSSMSMLASSQQPQKAAIVTSWSTWRDWAPRKCSHLQKVTLWVASGDGAGSRLWPSCLAPGYDDHGGKGALFPECSFAQFREAPWAERWDKSDCTREQTLWLCSSLPLAVQGARPGSALFPSASDHGSWAHTSFRARLMQAPAWNHCICLNIFLILISFWTNESGPLCPSWSLGCLLINLCRTRGGR